MDGVWPVIVVVALALACPLCMVVMAGIGWVVARTQARNAERPEANGSKA
jgi:hypothetical protein